MYKESHSEQSVALSTHFREALGHIRQYWRASCPKMRHWKGMGVVSSVGRHDTLCLGRHSDLHSHRDVHWAIGSGIR